MTPVVFFDKLRLLGFPFVTLLAVVWIWTLPSSVSHTAQIVGLAAVVLLLGLPHGALDPWIAKSLRLYHSRLQMLLFNIVYVGVCVAVIVAWVTAPVVCLLLFLIISGWHFSGDWKSVVPGFWRRSLGFLLLLMPVGFHTQEVALLFWHLSGEGGAALAHTLALPPWSIALWMVIIASVAGVQRQWVMVAEVMLLLVLAFAAPPLVYFSLYFCLMHSPCHMADIFKKAPHSDHAKLFAMMGFYTAAAVVGLGLLAWFWSTAAADTLLMRVVFVGLAAVTVPHMVLIGAANWRLTR